MSIKQYFNTLERIKYFPSGNKFIHIGRHALWQFRKIFDNYPNKFSISKSKIYALKKGSGAAALLYIFGEYDYNNINLIKLLLSRKKVFFDIGANVGVYSLIASEVKSAKVFAFEPHPNTYKFLKKNVFKNHRNNIKSFNIAVNDKNGFVLISDYDDDSINKIASPNEGTIKVRSLRGEGFCKKQKIIPEIIKIDTEGSELRVLAGFGTILKKIAVVFVEINKSNGETNRNKIEKHMNSNNFAGPYKFDYKKHVLSKKLKSFEDDIFVSKDALSSLCEFKIKIQ